MRYFYLVVILNLHSAVASLSSHRLCVDKKCDEPVSEGVVLMRYQATERGMVSVKPNEKVIIYSHPAGSNQDLMGIKVNGARGYVPRNYIRETRYLKWASEMVETEEWLRNPAPITTDGYVLPPVRQRSSDWHHKYMKSLKEKLERQKQMPKQDFHQQTSAAPAERRDTDAQLSDREAISSVTEGSIDSGSPQLVIGASTDGGESQPAADLNSQPTLSLENTGDIGSGLPMSGNQQHGRDGHSSTNFGGQQPTAMDNIAHLAEASNKPASESMQQPSSGTVNSPLNIEQPLDSGNRSPPGVEQQAGNAANQLPLNSIPSTIDISIQAPTAQVMEQVPVHSVPVSVSTPEPRVFEETPSSLSSNEIDSKEEYLSSQNSTGSNDSPSEQNIADNDSIKRDEDNGAPDISTGAATMQAIKSAVDPDMDSSTVLPKVDGDISTGEPELNNTTENTDNPSQMEPPDVEHQQTVLQNSGRLPAPADHSVTAQMDRSDAAGRLSEQVDSQKPAVDVNFASQRNSHETVKDHHNVLSRPAAVENAGSESEAAEATGSDPSAASGQHATLPEHEPLQSGVPPMVDRRLWGESVGAGATQNSPVHAETPGGAQTEVDHHAGNDEVPDSTSEDSIPEEPTPMPVIADSVQMPTSEQAAPESAQELLPPSSAEHLKLVSVSDDVLQPLTPSELAQFGFSDNSVEASDPNEMVHPPDSEKVARLATSTSDAVHPSASDDATQPSASANLEQPSVVDEISQPAVSDDLVQQSGQNDQNVQNSVFEEVQSSASSVDDSVARTDFAYDTATLLNADSTTQSPMSSQDIGEDAPSSYLDSSAQSAYIQSAYGESAYGESAYGESAYGKSAYGESAYAESMHEASAKVADESPGLFEQISSSLLPSSLWVTLEGVTSSAGGDGASSGSTRLSILLSTVGASLALLFIGIRVVQQLHCERALKQTVSRLQQRLTVHQEQVGSLQSQLDTQAKQAASCGSVQQLQSQLDAAAADQTAAEQELEDAQHQVTQLSQQVATLEHELAQSQTLLEEQMLKQSKPSSPPLPLDPAMVETVAKLDAELKQQRKKLMAENEKLRADKKRLHEQLAQAKPRIAQLEQQLAAMSGSSAGDGERAAAAEQQAADLRARLQEAVDRADQLTEQCEQLRRDGATAAQQVSRLEVECAECRQQLTAAQELSESLGVEVETLKTTLASRLQPADQTGGDTQDGDQQVQDILQAGKLQAQVDKLTKERAKLKEKWKQERELLKKAQATVEENTAELSKLSERCEKAEVDRFEAENKLEHIEKYFLKKELTFQHEIGVLKSQLSATEGDSSSSHDQVQRLTEELTQARQMVDSLKQEVQDQERSLRGQIQTLEKRSHESWVTCRQAERRLEEANREAAQYRALLTKTEEERNSAVNGPSGGLQSFNGAPGDSGLVGGATSPVLELSTDPLLADPGSFLPPPPPPPGGVLDPLLAPPLADPFLAAPPLPPPLGDPGRYEQFSPPLASPGVSAGSRYRDGHLSPSLSDRSERGYASSSRRPAPGREWSYSPERLSERDLSPERPRHGLHPPPPPPGLTRMVTGYAAPGPKTSSPLVDDYGRPAPSQSESRRRHQHRV